MGKAVASGAQRQAGPLLVAALGDGHDVVGFHVYARTTAGTAAVRDRQRVPPVRLLGAAGAPARDRAAPAARAALDQPAAGQTRALHRVPRGEIVGK